MVQRWFWINALMLKLWVHYFSTQEIIPESAGKNVYTDHLCSAWWQIKIIPPNLFFRACRINNFAQRAKPYIIKLERIRIRYLQNTGNQYQDNSMVEIAEWMIKMMKIPCKKLAMICNDCWNDLWSMEGQRSHLLMLFINIQVTRYAGMIRTYQKNQNQL